MKIYKLWKNVLLSKVLGCGDGELKSINVGLLFLLAG